MQYIAAVSGSGAEIERVKNQILESNPILEVGRCFCWAIIRHLADHLPYARVLDRPSETLKQCAITIRLVLANIWVRAVPPHYSLMI